MLTMATPVFCHRLCTEEEVERQRRSVTSLPSAVLRQSDQSLATGLHNIPGNYSSARGTFSVDTSLPWECSSNATWRDLGETYLPRYIAEVVCLDSTCWFGHYSCRPVIETIRVLKMNEANCRDPALPSSIRRQWLLAEVETSVFCQCAR